MESKNRILVVDDDTSNLIELAGILQPDYKIYAVKDGTSALEKANEVLPDLILLDIIMPDMSGFEVLNNLKSSEKTREIPVIFITGISDSEDEIKGLAAGAVDYLRKPLNDVIVKLKVRQQMQLLNQFRKIEHLRMIDQLTSLPNKRGFIIRLKEEYDRSSREHTPISILMVSVDDFKAYLQTHGIAQGDTALQMISCMFSKALKRPGDFAARWGDDKFVILLPNTDPRGASGVANKIRTLAEVMVIPLEDGSKTKMTVSIGVNTRMQGQTATIDEFVSWSDMALFAAKSKGKNRVCLFELPHDHKPAKKNDLTRSTIFIVDDNETNLTMAEEVLMEKYRVVALSSAAKMFKALDKFKPDLILLDVEMPDMNGFEAMKKLKDIEMYADIPVIFLTGLSDATSEAYGIELGAVDFIMKPFTEPVLLNRIKKHLDIDELVRERTRQLAHRTDQLARRSEQLVRLQNGIVFTLADVVENRDANTGGHVDRTSIYIELLINAMVEQGVYGEEMKDWDLESVISSARLHDLGKIAIPDSILNKPDKLTNEEFDVIKKHPSAGEHIIDQMTLRTGDADFLQNAKLFTAYHHEKWDGSGYPYSLKETDIPLHGRIMAVIDVYDALVSDRPYKKAFTHEKAVSIIMEDAGKHFDPEIAKAFYKINQKIADVREKLS